MKERILVTGASSGIGRAIAVALSKDYDLILNGRDESRLEATAAACAGGCDVRIWKFDLSQVEAIPAAIADFVAASGIVISGFVHSAGVSKLMPVGVTRLEDVQTTFRVNAVSAFQIVQALIAKRTNSAALKNVVFVSSAISGRGAKGYSVYGAAKSALDGFMRSLAVELAPKVRVNSVAPGFVKTPMTEPLLEDPSAAARIASKFPLGLGEPTSVADAVAFLLSDRAAWISGHQLVVDGGSTVDISL